MCFAHNSMFHHHVYYMMYALQLQQRKCPWCCAAYIIEAPQNEISLTIVKATMMESEFNSLKEATCAAPYSLLFCQTCKSKDNIT